MLNNALRYASWGWPVFPVHSIRRDGQCTCGRKDCDRPGKHPRCAHGLREASTDPETIRAWWKRWPEANIGLGTGLASGVVVLDVDGNDGKATLEEQSPIPTTATVRTRRGEHYYFTYPGRRVKSRNHVLPGLDSKGDGGYVILPPSRHAEGRYEWAAHPEETPVANAPAWWLQAVNGRETPTAALSSPPAQITAGTRLEAYVEKAVDDELRELAAAAPGTQNETLNRVCFAIGQFVGAGLFSRSDAEARIRAVVLSWPTSREPWTDENMRHTLRSGLDAGARSPRDIPAELLNGKGKQRIGLENTRPLKSKTAPETEETSEERRPALESLKSSAIARQWADLNRETYMFLEGGQWWHYTAGIWRYVHNTYVHRAIREYIEPLEGRKVDDKRRFAVTGTLIREIEFQSATHLLHSFSELNAQPNLIPLANSVYDLRTNHTIAHSPEHRLITQLPYNYTPDADCPLWKRFLSQVLINEDGTTCQEWVHLMQEWYGYCLIPSTAAEATMLWYGEGENGKGVASHVLETLVGEQNRISVPMEQLHEPYFRASIHGKLLGLCNELDRKALRKNGEYFKAIVAGDPVTARQPGERVFTFRPTLRIVMSTNELPETGDLSHGYFRRLMMIEWRYQVPKGQRDTELKTKLKKELPGIFNWALEGLRRFEKRGKRFPIVEASEEAIEQYRYSQDPVRQFIDEECEQDPQGCIYVGDLYAAFRKWADTNGINTRMTTNGFGRQLTRLKYHNIGPRNVGGQNYKMRSGLNARRPLSKHWPLEVREMSE